MMDFRDVKSAQDHDRWQDVFEEASTEEKTEMLRDMRKFLQDFAAADRAQMQSDRIERYEEANRRYKKARATGLRRVRGNSRRH